MCVGMKDHSHLKQGKQMTKERLVRFLSLSIASTFFFRAVEALLADSISFPYSAVGQSDEELVKGLESLFIDTKMEKALFAIMVAPVNEWGSLEKTHFLNFWSTFRVKRFIQVLWIISSISNDTTQASQRRNIKRWKWSVCSIGDSMSSILCWFTNVSYQCTVERYCSNFCRKTFDAF